MKKFIKYFWVLLVMMSFNFSFSSAHAEREQTNVKTDPTCTARRQYAYDYYGSECPAWDEFMVGIRRFDPLTIRCAQIKVECRGGFQPDTSSRQLDSVDVLNEAGE